MGLLYPLSDSCKKHIVTKRKLKSKKRCLMPPIKRQTSIAGGTVKYLGDSLEDLKDQAMVVDVG